jgi:hypothetical protein
MQIHEYNSENQKVKTHCLKYIIIPFSLALGYVINEFVLLFLHIIDNQTKITSKSKFKAKQELFIQSLPTL